MPDVFSKSERSRIMSAIKGKGNRSTEVKIRSLLRNQKITGWRSHLKELPGRPDFAFRRRRVAIFVDGCFWHGCKRCGRNLSPSSNRKFWIEKIARNQARDRIVGSTLRKLGWRTLRIWEHEIRGRSEACLRRIKTALSVRSKFQRVPC
jgi:DNA mismatch endonuclease (patch repair protein)